MRIILYGINFHPELTGIGKYSGEMVEWLASRGHDIKVVTAKPYYPEWKIHAGYNKFFFSKENVLQSTVYRCPLYVPKRLNAIKRLIHLISFAFSSFFALFINIFWKPDIIICIEPTLFCMPGAILFSKITNSKILLHIQDFEVDAMVGLGISKRKTITTLAFRYEKWCLNSANNISTISASMKQKAISKGICPDKVFIFANWTETKKFSNISNESVQLLRGKLGIPIEKKIILYSGNISSKQGLEIVIEAAKSFSQEDVFFLIVGEGGGKDDLIKLAKNAKLDNIAFSPLLPNESLPSLLKLADCHLVIQKKGAADAVLPSKLTNILAVGGNVVITAEKNTELGLICTQNPGIAVMVMPEALNDLVAGIKKALLLSKENLIAKNYASIYLEKNNILDNFNTKLNKIIKTV